LKSSLAFYDETLPIINKPKHPTKWGKIKNKIEGPTSKKTTEPPQRANHKGNIKFLNPLLSREAYRIGKGGGALERMPSLKNLHLRQQHISK
jgi:hypothetical protein